MDEAEQLRYHFLSDREAERLYRQHPKLKPDFREYCPTCHTERTYFWDGLMQKCDCQLQLQLHKHYLAAGIGVTYQQLSWDDFEGDPEVRLWMDDYLRNHMNYVDRGLGLVLYGDYGVGKTFSITLLLKDLIKLGYNCYSTTFAHMVEMFTAGWREPEEQRYFQTKIIGTDVLLLDDLGRDMKTKINLSETTFDDVLRRRVQDGKVTFLTTNMTIKELSNGYGGAILSLLWERSLRYEMLGSDFRPQSTERLLVELRKGLVRPIF